MSLATPVKIRTLQRKLYLKAKAEPDFRFYQLYDKVWRADIFAHAYRQARTNAGAPGVDGVTFVEIETAGREEWLARLREDLRQRTYRAQAVRRVMIPKPGGGERPLGIPTIRDRVVYRSDDCQREVQLFRCQVFAGSCDVRHLLQQAGRKGRVAGCEYVSRQDVRIDFLGVIRLDLGRCAFVFNLELRRGLRAGSPRAETLNRRGLLLARFVFCFGRHARRRRFLRLLVHGGPHSFAMKARRPKNEDRARRRAISRSSSVTSSARRPASRV